MGDVLAQTLRELGADRFRTRLSLLGVAVGIFSIVSALTLVDSVQKSVREGFSVYGGDILSSTGFRWNPTWTKTGGSNGGNMRPGPRFPGGNTAT